MRAVPLESGHSLVFLGHFDWDTPFMQFYRELLGEIANLGWKVLWVGGGIQLRQAPTTWFKRPFRGSLETEGALYHFRPWAPPGLRFGRLFSLPWREVARQVRSVLGRLGMQAPAVLLFTPMERFLLRRIPHGCSAYVAADEVILPGEAELTREADLILAISPYTFSEQRKLFPQKTVGISTGVAFERFHGALRSDYVPEDVRHLRHPVVGYAGSAIKSRLDLDLIGFLAAENPRLTFVFVGAMDSTVRNWLSRHTGPNVVVLGMKRYEETPHYIKHFDVGIIPYELNRFNLGSNPLKLYEYLALAKPVVSTRLPAVEEFAGIVWIADAKEEFSALLTEALRQKDDPKGIAGRLSVARAHSTKALARRIAEILSDPRRLTRPPDD